jgi:3-deoxy-manno-octulosonate cytidylyltransferase (CMP-KDO synthetase)
LNVQGDQLSLPRQAAVGALKQLEMGFSIGTAAARLEERHEIDRNRVKVAVDQGGCALSFSREMPENLTESKRMPGVFLHLGVYAYTRGVLLDWVDLPPTEAEFEEGLEQLRPFLNGLPIGVALLDEAVEPGIDTFEDLAHVQKSNHLTRTTA